MCAEPPEPLPERSPNTGPEHPRTPARTPPRTHSYTTYGFGAAHGPAPRTEGTVIPMFNAKRWVGGWEEIGGRLYLGEGPFGTGGNA